jgi:hypothetical protein
MVSTTCSRPDHVRKSFLPSSLDAPQTRLENDERQRLSLRRIAARMSPPESGQTCMRFSRLDRGRPYSFTGSKKEEEERTPAKERTEEPGEEPNSRSRCLDEGGSR